jgi:Ca2+/Na+ antiporter
MRQCPSPIDISSWSVFWLATITALATAMASGRARSFRLLGAKALIIGLIIVTVARAADDEIQRFSFLITGKSSKFSNCAFSRRRSLQERVGRSAFDILCCSFTDNLLKPKILVFTLSLENSTVLA